MILKNYITLLLVFSSLIVVGQNEVCTSSENEEEDLNSIGKCAIDNFKKSKETEFVKISTRKRVVRRRMSSNILNLRKSVKKSSSRKLSILEIDQIPLFEDCSLTSSRDEQQICFNNQIKHHINGNLKYPESAFKNGLEDKVLTEFVINEKGEVSEVKIISSKKHQVLEDEAKRLISSLPKLLPAKHKGIATKMKHKVYINFNLPNHKIQQFYEETEANGIIKDYIRFDKLSEAPVFIGCSDYEATTQQECIKETFVNNVLENLVYPFDAASEGIEARIWVRFIVDKEGYVQNITASGPENAKLLEEEAKRLITLLPKFLPGKVNNEYVNVEYFLPIDFQLDE
ncbi:MAG: energy transducer TonB [Tenacibaculum sp.]|nr:energy transducer TonB [Tenacibaculum sp.]